MDSLSATFNIFVQLVSIAIFGGTALLLVLESKAQRPAQANRKVGISPVDDTAHQIEGGVAEPANAGNTGTISKVA